MTDAFVRAGIHQLGHGVGSGRLDLSRPMADGDRPCGGRRTAPAETTAGPRPRCRFRRSDAAPREFGWWPSNVLVLTVSALAFGFAALTGRNMTNSVASFFDPNATQPGRWRLLIGIGLVIGGLAILSTGVGPLLEVGPVLLAVGLTLLGILIAFGPWVTRLARDLGAERRERIRQEERAEMAAHLHDSVLQTLALIQRSDDPARMSILARHQEGELREWLYGNAPLDGVGPGLDRSQRSRDPHRVRPPGPDRRGDGRRPPLDEPSRALVGAASEALVNAAKHSGSDRLSLYFEADEDQLSVFVTDQGKGFDRRGPG